MSRLPLHTRPALAKLSLHLVSRAWTLKRLVLRCFDCIESVGRSTGLSYYLLLSQTMAEIVADLQQRRELHDGSLPRRSSSMECSGSSGGSPLPCTSKQSESPPPKRVCFASPLEWEPRDPLMASPEWNPFDDESSAEERLKNQKPKSQPAKKARRKTILGGSPAITKRVLRPR